jgi:hypothetical protein
MDHTIASAAIEPCGRSKRGGRGGLVSPLFLEGESYFKAEMISKQEIFGFRRETTVSLSSDSGY